MSNVPRAACYSCGQVYVGYALLHNKTPCERCGGEVVEYEAEDLGDNEQRAAERVLAILNRESAWT